MHTYDSHSNPSIRESDSFAYAAAFRKAGMERLLFPAISFTAQEFPGRADIKTDFTGIGRNRNSVGAGLPKG